MAAVLALAVGLLAVPAMAKPSSLAAASVGPVGIEWQPFVQYEKMVLTVAGPDGMVLRREFAAGATPKFEAVGDDGTPLPDGAYTYELVAAPVLGPAARRALANARRTGDDSIVDKLRAEGKLPRRPLVQSGSFTIANGVILPQDLREDAAPRPTKAASGLTPTTEADQVIPDDLIVQGSTCVGFDCVNNESFGFDTIRLKENNTRIKFEDTSVGSFPTNDWQLTANDSASGASSKFSIEDITGAKVPFTITAGASTNSIFVDSTGRVGFRTSTPVLDLHVATSNTPAIRLEQNNSGGFTAQTWDIAGNEANFFVRDVTGGSRLPFRIRPGAPTSSIDISADGDVGIGTASPDEALHVSGSDGDTTVKVTETNGTSTPRTLFDLQNNGQVKFRMKDTAQTPEWQFTASNAFQIDNTADAGVEFQINPDGAVLVNGAQVHAADYVFDPSYKLMPLADLAAFVKEKRHLPNVPNAEEIKREGLNLVSFPVRLLEKIEELALYTIEQQKQIEGLASENSELKTRLAALEEQLRSN